MKKYFVYLMMALAAFTFNACGDDDPLQEEPGTEQPETPSDPTSVGEEPHSGWHSRLSNKPGLTCFV